MENGENSEGSRNKRREESVSSEDIDLEFLEKGNDTEREAQRDQGLHTHCTEIMSRLSRLNTGSNNMYHTSPLGKANASSIEWQR